MHTGIEPVSLFANTTFALRRITAIYRALQVSFRHMHKYNDRAINKNIYH
jgi:hypothetical protein